MKIYTGTGDAGETGLYGGQRVGKDDLRVEAYGTVDEASAALGVVAAHLASAEITDTNLAALKTVVEQLQRELFTVGADLATPFARETQAGKALVPRIKGDDCTRLEEIIDRYEADLTPLRQFIVPGGTLPAAALHLARTIARRAERRVVALHHAEPDSMNGEVIRYMNRLADLLFVLARAANHFANIPDVPWTRAETP